MNGLLGTVIARIAFQGWGNQIQSTMYFSQIEFVCTVLSRAETNDSSSSTGQSGGLPGWGIGLVVIGAISLLALAAAVVAGLVWHNKRTEKEKGDVPYQAM